MHVLLFVLSSAVSTSAIDCLERLVSSRKWPTMRRAGRKLYSLTPPESSVFCQFENLACRDAGILTWLLDHRRNQELGAPDKISRRAPLLSFPDSFSPIPFKVFPPEIFMLAYRISTSSDFQVDHESHQS